MPPKKKGKNKKDDDAGEEQNKWELIRARDALILKSKELASQTSDYSDKNELLSRDKAALLLVIAELEVGLKDVRERNAGEYVAAQARVAAARDRLAAGEAAASEGERAARLELAAGLDEREEEARLQRKIEEGQLLLAQERASNESKERELDLHAFNVRMQLTEVSRSAFGTINDGHEQRAIAALQAKADAALPENGPLEKALERHSEEVLGTMGCYDAAGVKLVLKRRDQELLEQAADLLRARVSKLRAKAHELQQVEAISRAQAAELQQAGLGLGPKGGDQAHAGLDAAEARAAAEAAAERARLAALKRARRAEIRAAQRAVEAAKSGALELAARCQVEAKGASSGLAAAAAGDQASATAGLPGSSGPSEWDYMWRADHPQAQGPVAWA